MPQNEVVPPQLLHHIWPRSYGGWQAGSIIRCEGADCRWCKARWKFYAPRAQETTDAAE